MAGKATLRAISLITGMLLFLAGCMDEGGRTSGERSTTSASVSVAGFSRASWNALLKGDAADVLGVTVDVVDTANQGSSFSATQSLSLQGDGFWSASVVGAPVGMALDFTCHAYEHDSVQTSRTEIFSGSELNVPLDGSQGLINITMNPIDDGGGIHPAGHYQHHKA